MAVAVCRNRRRKTWRECQAGKNEDSFHVRVPETRADDPMPLKHCQGKLSCGNFAAIGFGARQLCLEQAAAEDLGRLRREKTLNQLNHLTLMGCGELPPWAKFGVSRLRVAGPELKRGGGRPRKWLNANQRWWAWCGRKKGGIAKKRGRPKTARWIGISDRTRNSILNRELRARRKKQAEETCLGDLCPVLYRGRAASGAQKASRVDFLGTPSICAGRFNPKNWPLQRPASSAGGS
jgi:hypothetical protein